MTRGEGGLLYCSANAHRDGFCKLRAVSHPLCCLLKKFKKTQNKLLKSALVDFYSTADIAAAKLQFLKDIHEVIYVSFPHVPQQRQGDNRAERDVDDMFTLH